MTTALYQVCSQQLFAGGCSIVQCPLRHDAKFCDICSVVCLPDTVYAAHIRGAPHRAKAAMGRDIALLCEICQLHLTGEAIWVEHINGTAHQSRAQATGRSAAIYPRDPTRPTAIFCLLCKRAIDANSWSSHMHSGAHQRYQRNALHRSRFEQAEQDQRGVTVSDPNGGLDFGTVSLDESQRGLQRQLVVTLHPSASPVSITSLLVFTGTVAGESPYVF
ncbi:hypothetical protein NUW54_g13779 [Trametes sanguinea]|uniref:Uncharacterized protein n=1 Tax=Trametes sanguinea TaxID=158606 RepID=A0ACC1MHQ1_9APHY|nr:hypothetical protein NUW54_g13779 [Trametes sanguinea]